MPTYSKNALVLVIITVFFTLVIGCGTPTKPSTSVPPTILPNPTPPTPQYANLTGNWSFDGRFATGPYATTLLTAGAALSSADGQITGILHLLRSQCLPGARRLPYIQYANFIVTGTLDTNNNFSFQAASTTGSTLSANGIVSSDGTSMSLGSFSIHEVCGGGPYDTSGTSFEGSRLPSATGLWSGTITFDKTIGYGTTVPTITVTEHLTQADTPDSNGFFLITGTLTVSGSDCITEATGSGSITGGSGIVSFGDQTSSLSLPVYGLQASTFSSDATLQGSICGYREGQGQLTRQ